MPIAIDPGTLGAIAYTDHTGKAVCIKMPSTVTDIWEAILLAKHGGDEYGVAHAVAPINDACIIEKVAARPGNGATSMFNFGNIVGWAQMAIVAAELRTIEVQPKEWQKMLSLPIEPVAGLNRQQLEARKSKRKNMIKDKMQKRFPGMRVTLWNADALAMLSWGIEVKRFGKLEERENA